MFPQKILAAALATHLTLTTIGCGSSSSGAAPNEMAAGSSTASDNASTDIAGSAAEGDDGSTTGTSAGAADTAVSASLSSNPGVCPRDERIGTFQVYLKVDRTIVSGAVSTGVAPAAMPSVAASDGECQLLTPRDLFCSEGCDSGQTCAGDDACVATPEKVSAGTVQVTGLLEPVEVDPNGISLDYSKTISDPFPGFEAGAEIGLTAAGDVVEPFSLSAFGVAPLTSSADTVSVARDSGAALSWDASGVDPSQSEMFVSFTVNAHGAVTGWIECSVDDDGSFEIPAELVTQLIDLGLSGFPRVSLGRRSAANTQVSAGCVDLRVESELTLQLEVEGLTSCNTDEDCAEGTTCSPELACE